jgi:hypothetical protein
MTLGLTVHPEQGTESAYGTSPGAGSLAEQLALLVAYGRTRRPRGDEGESLARAIARLAVRLHAADRATPAALHREVESESAPPVWNERTETPYPDLVARLRETVARTVPGRARVAVVSRGDNDLLHIPDRAASHFPATQDGRYTGFYPPDGRAALAQLQAAIESGVDYLAIPETGRWWLDFYTEFGAFLRTECRTLVDDPAVGAVFELVPSRQESR